MKQPGSTDPTYLGESTDPREPLLDADERPAGLQGGNGTVSRSEGTSPVPQGHEAVLLEIARNLGAPRSLREFYRTLHRETARLVPAPAFFLSLYDRESDLATVVYFADRGREREARYTYAGSQSKAIRFRRPTLVRDRGAGRSLLLIGEDDRRAARSAITAPICQRERVLGTISVQSYESGAFGQEELQLLGAIAEVAAVPLEHALHVEDLERRRRDAEKLEGIARNLSSSLDPEMVLRASAEAVLEMVEVEEATVWTLGDDKVEVAESIGSLRHPMGRELPADEFVQRVMDGRPFVLLDDVESSAVVSRAFKEVIRPASAVFVPLAAGEQLLGMLSMGRKSRARFRQDEAAVLRRVADQAAVALRNANLHGKMQTLSVTDPLTGLPNRRHLQEHLRREVAAACRGRQLSVVVFDLDDFKGYNDSEGHPAGDQVLRRVASILAGETRAMNLVARFGGDEFISVLSDTDLTGAELHAQRVATQIADDPTLAEHELKVSFGAAEFGGEIQTATGLLQAADRAMFNQKTAKRRPSSVVD